MNTAKTIILTISVIVILAIMMLIIKFLLRKAKNKNTDDDGCLKKSFGIWFTTLFIAASIIALKSIYVLTEAVDNIYKISQGNSIRESAKTISLFIGLTVIWFTSWYFIVKVLSAMIVGNRSEEKEIEANNISYFLIRGILLIGFITCLLPVFEDILRVFIPSVQIPFYR